MLDKSWDGKWVVVTQTTNPKGVGFSYFIEYKKAVAYEKRKLRIAVAEIEEERCKRVDPGR